MNDVEIRTPPLLYRDGSGPCSRRIALDQSAATVTPVSLEIVDAFKGLKSADSDIRQKFYDLITAKGDARLIPALTAYRNGTLMLHGGSELAIYGDRVDVAGQGLHAAVAAMR